MHTNNSGEALLDRGESASAIAISGLVTIAVWLATSGLDHLGWGRDAARITACGVATALLLKRSDWDRNARPARLTLLLLVIGLAVGSLVAITRYSDTEVHIRNSGGIGSVVVHFLLVSAVVPLFEEIVVRRMLFLGAAFYLGAPVGAVIVSVLFGVSHPGSFGIAFFASLILCGMTWQGVSTLNRAVAHGAYNFSFTCLLLLMGSKG